MLQSQDIYKPAESQLVQWQKPLAKNGTIKPIMGETTPFVFKGRLYRLENWQKFMELPRANCGERYLEDVVRIWDVEADKLVSVALTGHSFGTAFVWNDRVYVFSAAHPATGQWRTVTEITLTTSDDLVHWTSPEVVLRAEPGEHLFNVAVCRGRDRFIMLYETNDRRWPPFTFKYCESTDLRHWTLIPDAIYGRDKYVGGPALYYEGDRYYTLYLQDLGDKWETRITRSRDLIHWEDAPAGRSFLTFDSARPFEYWQQGELRKVREINASDAELCEWRGKTLVYFNGGDQQSAGDLQAATFDGPPRALLESFYSEPTLITPSPIQLAFQEKLFGAFIHFGTATYVGSDMLATPKAEVFNPTELNAEQWVLTAKAMGAKHVVLTAKHHSGFCLWPTATTDYGVRSSPWKGGTGDVVRLFVEAARKHGVEPGIYISAGDKHFPCTSTPDPMGRRKLVGDRTAYFPVFREQVRELLTNYGAFCEIWFDGAFDPLGGDVAGPDGKVIGPAHWDEIVALVRKLQPQAVIMGTTQPDIRWAGNEEGTAEYPLWNILKEGQYGKYGLLPTARGWLPAEADVFTRPNWFWTPNSDNRLMSVDALLEIYYASVGHGANLLINLTPDTQGLIPEAEVARAVGLGAELHRRFDTPLAVISSIDRWGEGQTLELDLAGEHQVDQVIIEEDLKHGQRIYGYQLEAWQGNQWNKIAEGESIGRKRIHRVTPVKTDKLRLRVLNTEPLPKIRAFSAFSTLTIKRENKLRHVSLP